MGQLGWFMSDRNRRIFCSALRNLLVQDQNKKVECAAVSCCCLSLTCCCYAFAAVAVLLFVQLLPGMDEVSPQWLLFYCSDDFRCCVWGGFSLCSLPRRHRGQVETRFAHTTCLLLHMLSTEQHLKTHSTVKYNLGPCAEWWSHSIWKLTVL